MEAPANPHLARLAALLGDWDVTATLEDRVLSKGRTTFRWLEDRRFLFQRTDPQSFLIPEWEGKAPTWADSVYGADDYSGVFHVLYSDSRGVSRTYSMTLEAGRWKMSSRPGADFFQRFDGTFNGDGDVIDGSWEASEDNEHWRTDFNVTYRRVSA